MIQKQGAIGPGYHFPYVDGLKMRMPESPGMHSDLFSLWFYYGPDDREHFVNYVNQWYKNAEFRFFYTIGLHKSHDIIYHPISANGKNQRMRRRALMWIVHARVKMPADAFPHITIAAKMQ